MSPLKDETNQPIVEPKQQAELLNNFFASVFTRYDGKELPKKDQLETNRENLNDIHFDEKTVETKIKEMQSESAPGPDGIKPKILKEVAKEMSKPLAILFNKSMQEGKIPDDWRKANVTPLFKKGSKFVQENYRPVSDKHYMQDDGEDGEGRDDKSLGGKAYHS